KTPAEAGLPIRLAWPLGLAKLFYRKSLPRFYFPSWGKCAKAGKYTGDLREREAAEASSLLSDGTLLTLTKSTVKII
ncbi:hypothetical protein, partial [Brucella melitensis]|uniref:hypothetical protein n=2 Tax=Brucella melitensis TaxID=29459 RepID=UPI0004638D2B